MQQMRPIALMLAAALAVLPLSGCWTGSRDTAMPALGSKMAPPARIRLGSVPAEDILPLLAAKQQGVFDKVGLKVEVVPFASAQLRDAAFKSGAVDGYAADIFTVARLRDAGFGNRIVTICLGVKPAQGRVGIVAAPGSRIRLVRELANVPIATSRGSMDEFVLDGLLRRTLQTWVIQKQYIETVSERSELLTTRKIKAAVLPEPYLSLALRRGAHLIAADNKRDNLSQTVLAFSDRFLASPGGASAVNRLLGAWDSGSSLVNAHNKVFRPLLVTKAGFPTIVAKRYRMNRYPYHQLPNEAEVSAVIAWMKARALLRTTPTYAQMIWKP